MSHDEDNLDNNEALVADESDEDEFIVIRSRKVLLRDRVQQLLADNEALECSKRSLQFELDARLQQADRLGQDNERLTRANKQLDSTLKAVDRETQLMGQRIQELESKLAQSDSRSSEATQTDAGPDFEAQNRVLKQRVEELEGKCAVTEQINKDLVDQLSANDRLILDDKQQIVRLGKELVELKNEKRSETEHKVDSEQDLLDLRTNFQMMSDECERLAQSNTELENRINRIKGKVKKYFDIKASTECDPYLSATLCHTLMSRTETELKEAVDTDLISEVISMSDSMTASNVSLNSRSDLSGDRRSLVPVQCKFCDLTIECEPDDQQPLNKHLEDQHYRCLCPVCGMPFDLTFEGHSTYFQMHIDNHFDRPYPR